MLVTKINLCMSKYKPHDGIHAKSHKTCLRGVYIRPKPIGFGVSKQLSTVKYTSTVVLHVYMIRLSVDSTENFVSSLQSTLAEKVQIYYASIVIEDVPTDQKSNPGCN